MHDVTRESLAAMTDNFADALVRKNVACVYMTLWRHSDVPKFDADTILFEKSSVRTGILNVVAMFSLQFMLKSGKIC